MSPSDLVAKLRSQSPSFSTISQAADCIEDLLKRPVINVILQRRAEAAEKELAKKSEWLDCANQLLKNAEKRAAKYKEALVGLKRASTCWCEVAIGNPMLSGRHLPQCDAAKLAMEQE